MANSLGVTAIWFPFTLTLCVRMSTVSGPCCSTWAWPAGCLLRRSTALILASSSCSPNGLIR